PPPGAIAARQYHCPSPPGQEQLLQLDRLRLRARASRQELDRLISNSDVQSGPQRRVRVRILAVPTKTLLALKSDRERDAFRNPEAVPFLGPGILPSELTHFSVTN